MHYAAYKFLQASDPATSARTSGRRRGPTVSPTQAGAGTAPGAVEEPASHTGATTRPQRTAAMKPAAEPARSTRATPKDRVDDIG